MPEGTGTGQGGRMDGGGGAGYDTTPTGMELLTRFDGKLDEVKTIVQAVQIDVQEIKSSKPSREEMQREDEKRLLIETYNAAMLGVNERLTRMEGSWQRLLPWVSIAIGIAAYLHH